MRLIFKNNIIHSMPILDDLSQGSRIAYKMKLEAIKHQGKKKSLLHNLCQSYLHPG